MVKLKVEWSTDAKSDLLDILDFYVRRNKNAIYSKKLNADIDDSIKLLSRYPSLGLQTDYESVRALITFFQFTRVAGSECSIARRTQF